MRLQENRCRALKWRNQRIWSKKDFTGLFVTYIKTLENAVSFTGDRVFFLYTHKKTTQKKESRLLVLLLGLKQVVYSKEIRQ